MAVRVADPLIGSNLCKRLDSLRGPRRNIEWIWRQCYDVTHPIRGAGIAQSGSVLPDGQGRAESYAQAKQPEIYDSTAPDAVLTQAAGLQSGMTPANSRWFALDQEAANDTEGGGDASKRWLDEAADELWEHIHNSNFDSVAFECMVEASIAGLFAMFVDEDPEGGLKFEEWPLAQCFFAASKTAGPIDTCLREFSLTLEQLVAEYGVESLDTNLRKMWDDAPTKPEHLQHSVEIVWGIYPRETGVRRGSKFGYALPFASCHVVKGSKHVLRESGYHEFPVIAPRWMVVPGSIYAVGPMYTALYDTKTLNEIVKLDIMNLDVAITGMWIAKDDGVLNPRSIKLGPRKIIVANDVDSMKALTSGANVQAALLEIERLQKSIRHKLMADHLEPQDKADMTAYEVHVRVDLIRQLLGPIYGRMQAEYLAPLVKRCFGLAYRAGALGQGGDIPESIRRQHNFRVKYISPLARAQKLVDVASMDRYETTLAQEEKVRPGVADNYDWDAGARMRAELLGVPMKLIPDEDQIAEVRAKREKQAQQAQAMELAAKGSGMGGMGGGLDAPINPGVGLGADAALLAT